jgi:hypothetical protein
LVEGVVTGAVGGLMAALSFAVLVWVYRRVTQTSRTIVRIQDQDFLRCKGVWLGVLHARDDGQIVNRVYRPKSRPRGFWTATVSHRKGVGFQYKWFVDCEDSALADQVVTELERAGFTRFGKGSGKANRVWFIDDTSPTAQDPEHPKITNNMLWPE